MHYGKRNRHGTMRDLVTAPIFNTLDLKSGFWQITMDTRLWTNYNLFEIFFDVLTITSANKLY